MEQGRSQEKTEKLQEERIREMEQVISLLEKESGVGVKSNYEIVPR